MFKMSSEKKDKFIKKIDKMTEFLDEFKECLESGGDYDEDDGWEEDSPQFKAAMRRAMKSAMRSRYGKKSEMY